MYLCWYKKYKIDMKLISMTDFVIHECFGVGNSIISKEVFYDKCSNYAQFLKQPLNLGMFVPCDLEGNVLEEPEKVDLCNHTIGDYEKQLIYKQAKERVLFEDIKVIRNSHNFFIIEPTKGTIFYRILKNNTTVTIEDLFKLRTDIILTKSAQKQL